MAQKQFTTFQADILSFELREALMGIIRPGRFSGFDQIAADGTPAGGTIYLVLSHSANGIAKLPKSAGALGDPVGVAMTTQGTIIHEDDDAIDIDIPDNSGSGSIRWYVIYMEHDYVEVQGANNATYSFISGTPGAGIPALTEAYHRVLIGYIRADGLATSISGLTYFPANSTLAQGDDKLNEMLWGTGDGASKFFNKLNEAGADVGVIPSDGAIGQRDYTVGYFITDYESITDSLEAIDLQLHILDLEMTAVEGTKLDDWATPDDNTDLDATAARHGLLPKLSGQNDEFFRGDGTWAVPVGGRMIMRSGAFGTDVTLLDTAPTTGSFDVSSIVPADADAVLLLIRIDTSATTTGGNRVHIQFRSSASGGFNAEVGVNQTPTTEVGDKYAAGQCLVPCDGSKNIFYSLFNKSYIDSSVGITITVVGWQSYLP